MDVLPYEILQLVASYLLPKYQCRLALTSRHCYLYLYNDLLRWHARKAPVEVFKYMILDNQSAIRFTQSIVYYTGRGYTSIYVTNLTKRTSTWLSYDAPHDVYFGVYGVAAINIMYRTRDLLRVEGRYKSLHRDYLLELINVSKPIFNIPIEIRKNIRDYARIYHGCGCPYQYIMFFTYL